MQCNTENTKLDRNLVRWSSLVNTFNHPSINNCTTLGSTVRICIRFAFPHRWSGGGYLTHFHEISKAIDNCKSWEANSRIGYSIGIVYNVNIPQEDKKNHTQLMIFTWTNWLNSSCFTHKSQLSSSLFT